MRPSAGKKGVDGKYVVRVLSGPRGETRVLARRFLTEAEAREFFTRTVVVHQQKANREHRLYAVTLYTTRTPRSTETHEVLADVNVAPA